MNFSPLMLDTLKKWNPHPGEIFYFATVQQNEGGFFTYVTA